VPNTLKTKRREYNKTTTKVASPHQRDVNSEKMRSDSSKKMDSLSSASPSPKPRTQETTEKHMRDSMVRKASIIKAATVDTHNNHINPQKNIIRVVL